MDYQAFVRQVERGEAPPIALLHGGDGQLLDDALDAATRGLFPDRALAAWGREVFDGRERGVDEIVRSAMTLPLGSGRRLVAVRRAQALAAKGADALTVYAASPNPATCLLLAKIRRGARKRQLSITTIFIPFRFDSAPPLWHPSHVFGEDPGLSPPRGRPRAAVPKSKFSPPPHHNHTTTKPPPQGDRESSLSRLSGRRFDALVDYANDSRGRLCGRGVPSEHQAGQLLRPNEYLC